MFPQDRGENKLGARVVRDEFGTDEFLYGFPVAYSVFTAPPSAIRYPTASGITIGFGLFAVRHTILTATRGLCRS